MVQVHTYCHTSFPLSISTYRVSNFAHAELKDLLAFATIKPQVVQVHVDPLAQATDILDLCTANGIQVEAYSSLGTQQPPSKSVYRNGAMVGGGNAVLTNPLVERLAEKLKRSPAQVGVGLLCGPVWGDRGWGEGPWVSAKQEGGQRQREYGQHRA